MDHVNENLWRGPLLKDWAPLKAQGFEQIIDLESGVYRTFHPQSDDPALYLTLGITDINIKLSPICIPRPHKVVRALSLIANGLKTYLHCLLGVDRTGYVVAAYRMTVQHWDFEEAVDDMMDHGFHKYRYFYWVPSLFQYEVSDGREADETPN